MLILASLLSLVSSMDSPPKSPDSWNGRDRVVHEWGTLTSVQGSDGVTLDGLRHDDRDLPKFVRDLGGKYAFTALDVKMETPVIYFYSPVRWKTVVHVKFPHGLITQWYPPATSANLAIDDADGHPAWRKELLAAPKLEKGFIDWGDRSELTVMARNAKGDLAPCEAGDPWNFSRAVDANLLDVCDMSHRGTKGEARAHARTLPVLPRPRELPAAACVQRHRGGTDERESAAQAEARQRAARPATHGSVRRVRHGNEPASVRSTTSTKRARRSSTSRSTASRRCRRC
jgi:hypothetical protein